MKHKAYLKSTGRLFLKHLVRLLSISAIFVVTVSLISGIGDVEGDIKKSITASYQQDHLHDFVIRGASFELEKLKNAIEDDIVEIETPIEQFYTYDTPDPDDNNFASRAVFREFINQPKNPIDKLKLIEGKFPENDNEVVVERSTNDFVHEDIGKTIDVTINPTSLPSVEPLKLRPKIVGIVKNPTMISLYDEPSDYYGKEKNRYVNKVIYFDTKALPNESPYRNSSALHLAFKNRSVFESFSDKYKNEIDNVKKAIETLTLQLSFKTINTITLNENFSLVALDTYGEKVGLIVIIFIVFFIAIAVLVIYSTMSRLLDEDRGSMAVLKTLGYSNFAIAARYIAYVFIAGIIGAAISTIPTRFVTQIILNAFAIQYDMKQIALPLVGYYFFIFSGIIILASVILTLIKGITTADHKPVELLTPKAPKAGKRTILERIKPFWNKLSFRYKSTFRNVFFFKGRLLMTILSIMAATVLVFASFSLLNNSTGIKGFESLEVVSIVLLAFSAGLCALVIYNITNINISERTREIATLMVLGYRNNEVTGYVYREIYILTAIGAILGVPAGLGFIKFVFEFIGFFDISKIAWWTYVASPIITFVFALIATRLLHLKIVRTDMNESLKVLE